MFGHVSYFFYPPFVVLEMWAFVFDTLSQNLEDCYKVFFKYKYPPALCIMWKRITYNTIQFINQFSQNQFTCNNGKKE